MTDLSGQARKIDGFTVGTGLNFNRFVFDVAYEQRRSTGIVSLRFKKGELIRSQSPPTETIRQHRFVAAMIYRAGGEDDPLKRALRFLFVGGEKDKE